jgi:hypothetical protein
LTTSQYEAELTLGMSDDTPESQAVERCMVLIKLAAEGDLSRDKRVRLLGSTVPASYSSATKTVTFVVPDGDTPRSVTESAYLLLAHEYVHALQDQEHDLTALQQAYSSTTDGALALRSLIEGEATVHETNFAVASWGISPDDVLWSSRDNYIQQFDAKALEGYSPLLATWRSFPYEAGAPYVRGLLQADGMRSVRQAFDNPPQATLALTSEVVPSPIDANAPLPPVDYELVAVDTLGAELLRASMLGFSSATAGSAARLANEWRGDRVYCYRSPTTANVALFWRLRFASEAARETVLANQSDWSVAAFEDDVVIGLTSDRSRTDVLSVLLTNLRLGVTVPVPGTTEAPNQASSPPRLLQLLLPPLGHSSHHQN